MGRKKKNKSATAAVARKVKKRKSNARPTARKASAKNKKPAATTLAVLNADKLKQLYCTMMKCRMLAERIAGARISRQQPDRDISGFEATLVGAGAHLLPQDCVIMEHSGFIASLIKGTPLPLIFSRARDPQGKNGVGKSVLSSGKAASAKKLTMSAGLALAHEMKGKGAVALIFCTQNPETLAFDADAMALAATHKLPMVCLVESSIDTPSQSQAPSAVAGDDPGYYPRIPVDGCDAVAVFRVAQEAIRRAREGHGPALIECLVSRTNGLAADAGNDATAPNAPPALFSADPLSFMEQYLRRRDLWSDEWSRLMVAAFARELNDAAAAVDEPTVRDVPFDNVYSADGWSPPRPAKVSPQQATMLPTP
jgi:TPP-dependent pyruvate/acetoin dehydrogenase alpha subunit